MVTLHLRMQRVLIAVIALATTSVACSGHDTYTLYRNTVGADTTRVHVATFDAAESGDYNRQNCEQARELFQAQPAIKTRFWCEKGRFAR